MLHFKLFVVQSVDSLLQSAGNLLLTASDRWLFVTTADGPLETMIRR
jgi:hypothetical protein